MGLLAGITWWWNKAITHSASSSKEIIEVLQQDDPSAKVLAADGTFLWYTGKMVEKKELLEYKDINPYFVLCLLAAEDADYFSHDGTDRKATLRSLISLWTKGWWSTLDMQAADHALQQLGQPNRYWLLHKVKRKLIERHIAEWFYEDEHMTKEKMFALGIQNFDFWAGNYGIEQAAHYYFGKQQKDLSLDECAMLAALWANPTSYNPRKSPKQVSQRIEYIQDQIADMREDNFRGIKDHVSLDWESLAKDIQMPPALRKLGNYESIAHQFVKQEARQRVDKYYKEMIAKDFKGEIHTTIDAKMQAMLLNLVEDFFQEYQTAYEQYGGKDTLNIGAVVVDTKTGRIESWIGNSHLRDNDIIRADLSMGSNHKPLTIATAMGQLGKEKYHPDSSYVDRSTTLYDKKTYPDSHHQFSISGGSYTPKNFDKYSDASISYRDAMEKSLNTMTAKILSDLGSTKAIKDGYQKFGIDYKGMTDKDGNYIDAPGAIVGWVEADMLQIVDAYRTLVNNGRYSRSYRLESMKIQGETTKVNPPDSRNAIDPTICSYVNEMLHAQPMKDPNIKEIFAGNQANIIGKSRTSEWARSIWYIVSTGKITVIVGISSKDSRSEKAKNTWAQGTKMRWLVGKILKALYEAKMLDPNVKFETKSFLTSQESSSDIEQAAIKLTAEKDHIRINGIPSIALDDISLYDHDGVGIADSYSGWETIDLSALADGTYTVVLRSKKIGESAWVFEKNHGSIGNIRKE